MKKIMKKIQVAQEKQLPNEIKGLFYTSHLAAPKWGKVLRLVYSGATRGHDAHPGIGATLLHNGMSFVRRFTDYRLLRIIMVKGHL
jgi:hypothetical protein